MALKTISKEEFKKSFELKWLLKPRHTSKVTNLKYDNGWHNILHIVDLKNKYLKKNFKGSSSILKYR